MEISVALLPEHLQQVPEIYTGMKCVVWKKKIRNKEYILRQPKKGTVSSVQSHQWIFVRFENQDFPTLVNVTDHTTAITTKEVLRYAEQNQKEVIEQFN